MLTRPEPIPGKGAAEAFGRGGREAAVAMAQPPAAATTIPAGPLAACPVTKERSSAADTRTVVLTARDNAPM